MKTIKFSGNKDRAKLNIIIDTIMFIFMMLVAGIGFLIKYCLVPGFKRNEIYGPDVELTFLTLDRHQWGSIHLKLSIVLLALIILHVALHWKMVVCIVKRMIPKAVLRIWITSVIFLLLLLFSVAPFFIQPKQQYQTPNYRNQTSEYKGFKQTHPVKHNPSLQEKPCFDHNTKDLQLEQANENVIANVDQRKPSLQRHENEFSDINGRLTLVEVSRKYNMDTKTLATSLGIPMNKTNQRLGRLRKEYGFQMTEVRNLAKKQSGK